MKVQVRLCIAAVGCFLALTLSAPNAIGSVIGIGINSFPSNSPVIDFTGLAFGLEVNGLTVNGVQFTYTVGGNPLNGAVVIDGGPGTTNNVSPLNIVSVGNNTGTLTMALPSTATIFGYGFALLNTNPIPNATIISLFSGSTPVGALLFPATPDPIFTGGFAGIESTIPFDRVAVTFNPIVAPAFALDNIRYSATVVPEPSTLLLLASGIGVLLFTARFARNRQS